MVGGGARGGLLGAGSWSHSGAIGGRGEQCSPLLPAFAGGRDSRTGGTVIQTPRDVPAEPPPLRAGAFWLSATGEGVSLGHLFPMDGGYFEFMAHLGHAIWLTQEQRGGQGGSERTQGSAGSSPAARQPSAAQGRGPAPKPAGSVAAFLTGGLRAVGPQEGRLLPVQATGAARPKQAEASGEGREEGGICEGTTPKAAAPGPPLGRPREEAKSQPDAKGGVPVAPTAERGVPKVAAGGAPRLLRRRRRTVQKGRRSLASGHRPAQGASSSRSRTPRRGGSRGRRRRTRSSEGGRSGGACRSSGSRSPSYSSSGGSRSETPSERGRARKGTPNGAQGRGGPRDPGGKSGRSPQAGAQRARGLPHPKSGTQRPSASPYKGYMAQAGGCGVPPYRFQRAVAVLQPHHRDGRSPGDRRDNRSRGRSRPVDRGGHERGRRPQPENTEPDGGKGKKGKGKPHPRQRPPRGVRPGRGAGRPSGQLGAEARAGSPRRSGAGDRRQRSFGSSGTDA